jgi:hypothetical protein
MVRRKAETFQPVTMGHNPSIRALFCHSRLG